MENSSENNSWNENYDTINPSNLDLWDAMIFPDLGPMNGTSGSSSFAHSNIDNMISTPRNVQDISPNNQEFLYNLGDEIFSPSHSTPRRLMSPFEGLSAETSRDTEVLQNRLQEVKRELVAVKSEVKIARSELYTIKSNHVRLVRWTLNMNETMNALSRRLAEHLGANIIGQERAHEGGSWLDSEE